MPIHDSPHPRSDQTATIESGPFAGTVRILDWFDRRAGASWMMSDHLGVLVYASRREAQGLPFDDEVVLVVTDKGQHGLVHVDELAAPTPFMNGTEAACERTLEARMSALLQDLRDLRSLIEAPLTRREPGR